MYPDIVERLKDYFDVTINEGAKFSPEELSEALHDKEGVLVAGGEKFNAQIIDTLPNLKAVCVSSAGYNNIDVDALTKAGVIVTNAPGEAGETVADFAWALIIASSRNLLQA
jgi:lactate dehydrogenase-like 2-hydroxyacid dehydrogenase